jgi:protein gp138
MDQRERYDEPTELYRVAGQSLQSRIWTAIPCVVKQFPAASGLGTMILDAQPTINGLARLPNSQAPTPIQMPVLLDCPILWMGGGGVTSTFPIKAGDECLVIFASRCIDAWWKHGFTPGQNGNANPAMNPPDLRMHNLSDGFALVGLRSLPNSFAVDTANACLISDDGASFIKLNPTTQAVNITAPGGITANGVTIDDDGNVVTPANLAVGNGATGSFTTLTGQTVTVQDGIVTNIF